MAPSEFSLRLLIYDDGINCWTNLFIFSTVQPCRKCVTCSCVAERDFTIPMSHLPGNACNLWQHRPGRYQQHWFDASQSVANMPQGSQGECGWCSILITFRSVFIIMTLCVMCQFNEISNLSGGARFANFYENPFSLKSHFYWKLYDPSRSWINHRKFVCFSRRFRVLWISIWNLRPSDYVTAASAVARIISYQVQTRHKFQFAW